MNRLWWPQSNNPLDSIIWTLVVGALLVGAVLLGARIYATA